MRLRDDEDAPFLETLAELEYLCEQVDHTVQFTYRVKVRPAWLVRIGRKHYGKGRTIYRQAEADSLSEAFESAYVAWAADVEAERAGRKSGTVVVD